MTLSSGNLTVREFKTAPLATDKAILHLLKEDTSPATGDSIGAIDFDILDGTTTTNYARIEGLVDNSVNSGRIALKVLADGGGLIDGLLIAGDNNNAESFLTVSSLINSSLEFGVDAGAGGVFNIGSIQSGLGAGITIGIVVQDNVSYTVGTNGSIVLPSEDLVETPIPTKAQLDTKFGTHKGAIGFDRSVLGASKLYIRDDATGSSDWSFYSADGKITV